MAPAVLQRTPSGNHIRQVSRSLSLTFSSLKTRAADISDPPLASIFALVITKGSSLSARTASAISDQLQTSGDARAATSPLPLGKRQNQILAIPTTYKGLNAGPAPGAVVGIILGSIAGFIFCLYVLLFAFQFTGGRTEIVKEEIITTTKRQRSQSRRSSHHTQVSEQAPRRETIIIEETTRRPSRPRPAPELDEVIVEEHEDDIVEVIEDPSSVSSPSPPPRPPPAKSPPPQNPSRRESRRSGYRTVDPAEFGGGRDSMKRVRRRD